MALRLRDFIDRESSTETPVAEPSIWTFHDIFQAANAASVRDSDGEDPYGPQPKRFMQTEHQKRQLARDLEIRRMAWTMRKMKKDHKANHQRRKKQKQRPSPFEKLPSDLVLKLMQHIHLRNISELINSSAINQSIFKANQTAIFRGIEIEQLREWKWLFGDSKYRTSAQAQHLKDAIISENYCHDPGAHGWAYDEQLLEILRMIDNNEFTGVRNVMFLQDMQDRVDVDINATESYTKTKIARRTAICLRSLSFGRPGIVEEKERTEYRPLVNALILPWEARSQLVNEQPGSIQAEIRSILTIVIEKIYHTLQHVVRLWSWQYYNSPGEHLKPQAVKKWMSKVVTGLILESVMPQWRAETISPSQVPCFMWKDSRIDLAGDLVKVLNEHDIGKEDAIQAVKNGVEFGKRIGLDVGRLLDGTMAGEYIDIFGEEEAIFS